MTESAARYPEGPITMRGRSARWIGAVLVLLTLAMTAGRALGQDIGSPASGHAEVIAHGVIPMPTDELTWRLYDGVAGPLDDAEPLTTDWSGFVLGGDDPILVDVDGDRSVVSEGKATVVREGANLTVASLDGDEADYGWLTLTAAELTEDDGALAMTSEPFDVPSDGDHQVDLVRDVLADDEETEIAAGSAPTVLLVVAGEAAVAVDGPGGDSERIEAGESLTADGELALRARDDDTVVLAAVIGEPVSTGDSPTPTPVMSGDNQQPGAIELTVQTCAPGITVENISDEVCPFTEPEDGDLQLLTFEGTEPVGSLAVADLEPGQTGFVWTGLWLRTHVLQVFASDPETVYVEETDQVALIPGPQWEITLTADAPYALVPIYRLTAEVPEEDVSTVTVTFLGCEPGQDPESFRPENCVETIAGSAELANEDSGVYLGPEEAVPNDDGSLTWTYLGYDRLAVVDVVLPEGYVAYALSEAVVVTGPDAPDADVYVYAFLPLEESFLEE